MLKCKKLIFGPFLFLLLSTSVQPMLRNEEVDGEVGAFVAQGPGSRTLEVAQRPGSACDFSKPDDGSPAGITPSGASPEQGVSAPCRATSTTRLTPEQIASLSRAAQEEAEILALEERVNADPFIADVLAAEYSSVDEASRANDLDWIGLHNARASFKNFKHEQKYSVVGKVQALLSVGYAQHNPDRQYWLFFAFVQACNECAAEYDHSAPFSVEVSLQSLPPCAVGGSCPSPEYAEHLNEERRKVALFLERLDELKPLKK